MPSVGTVIMRQRGVSHAVAIAGLIMALLAAGTVSAASDVSPNPKNPFAEAMAKNIYQTRNYYIGAYHYIQCYGTSLVIPENTSQVTQAVAYYYSKAKAGQPVTMRTSRPRFHSSADFVCPISPAQSAAGGKSVTTEKGAKTPITVGILQTKLNKVLAVDKQKYTMRIGAGMKYTEFLKAATQAGMSVQIGTPTAYGGLTLGGVLATSAHGSGDLTISGLWDTLLEITWVDGTGKVHVSKPGDAEFRGALGGLGVFGIMTEFLMQMTPPKAIQLITVRKSDKDMFKTVQELLKITPHILIFWRPDVSSFTAYMIKEAPKGAKVAKNVSMTLLPDLRGQTKAAEGLKIMSSRLVDDSDAFDFLCPLQTDASLSSFWGSVNGKGVMNVTGPANDLMASECDDHCNWNDNEVLFGTAQDVELTAEFDQLEDWIADVQKIMDVELKENGKAKYRCLGPGYLWIRFGAGFDGFTATNSGLKRPVYLQSTWIRSRAVPNYPIRYQFVPDLIEQLTLCKYNARPHWGKNFDRTFTFPKCGIRAKYPKFDGLLKLQKAHDPEKMFEPELFNKVVKNEKFALTPHCTLWQQCYCEQDIHCPQGWKCVSATSFPEYKVCKYPNFKNVPGSILPDIFKVMAG
eukprot:GHUV01001150.1.p1 GENE.GHUV01001150.1~~GHUV01001150.1.p1  ORF type:complete len:631 (+),score=62.78 GHUV01001150.1:321-2213(+)